MKQKREDALPYAGCYTVDLYCDRADIQHWEHNYCQTFGGQTLGQCLKAARAAGWVIHKDDTATCPLCYRKGQPS